MTQKDDLPSMARLREILLLKPPWASHPDLPTMLRSALRGELRGGLPQSSGAAAAVRDLRRLLRQGAIVLATALAILGGLSPAFAQEEHKRKVPGLDKITSGPTRQAFSGKIQLVDLDRHLLQVSTVEGGSTEIFPVKKGVPVSTADGGKLKLKALKPGADIIVYFEQKADRRTVKQIVILAGGSGQEKKKSPPPS